MRVFVAVSLVLVLAAVVNANDDHTPKLPAERTNALWMKDLCASNAPGVADLPFHRWMMPGTHDSGCIKGFEKKSSLTSNGATHAQKYRLREQLFRGVRLMDIRFAPGKSHFRIDHGGFGTYQQHNKVFREYRDFFAFAQANNGAEVTVMRLKAQVPKSNDKLKKFTKFFASMATELSHHIYPVHELGNPLIHNVCNNAAWTHNNEQRRLIVMWAKAKEPEQTIDHMFLKFMKESNTRPNGAKHAYTGGTGDNELVVHSYDEYVRITVKDETSNERHIIDILREDKLVAGDSSLAQQVTKALKCQNTLINDFNFEETRSWVSPRPHDFSPMYKSYFTITALGGKYKKSHKLLAANVETNTRPLSTHVVPLFCLYASSQRPNSKYVETQFKNLGELRKKDEAASAKFARANTITVVGCNHFGGLFEQMYKYSNYVNVDFYGKRATDVKILHACRAIVTHRAAVSHALNNNADLPALANAPTQNDKQVCMGITPVGDVDLDDDFDVQSDVADIVDDENNKDPDEGPAERITIELEDIADDSDGSTEDIDDDLNDGDDEPNSDAPPPQTQEHPIQNQNPNTDKDTAPLSGPSAPIPKGAKKPTTALNPPQF